VPQTTRKRMDCPVLLKLALLLLLSVTAALCQTETEITYETGEDGVRTATHEGRTIRLAFDEQMASFARQDAEDPGKGQIVFTGSSSFVGWKTLKQDMAPLPVTNRAFGGSNSGQLWYYAEQAILPREPRVLVVYIGDNDMPPTDVTVEIYMKYIDLFVQKVRAKLPSTRIAFVSSKPSVARWHLWDKYLLANKALKAYCKAGDKLTYIDITPTLLDEDHVVRPECFVEDKLHLKAEVYAAWTAVVKPVVEQLWAEANAEGQ